MSGYVCGAGERDGRTITTQQGFLFSGADRLYLDASSRQVNSWKESVLLVMTIVFIFPIFF